MGFKKKSGDTSFGIPISSVIGERNSVRRSSPPLALNIPIAVISPISEGAIEYIVFKPSLAPSVKQANTGIFFISPVVIIVRMIVGIIRDVIIFVSTSFLGFVRGIILRVEKIYHLKFRCKPFQRLAVSKDRVFGRRPQTAKLLSVP